MPATARRVRTRVLVDLLARYDALCADLLEHCVSDARVSGPAAEQFFALRARLAAELGCDVEELEGNDE